jgi:hypothetical protein
MMSGLVAPAAIGNSVMVVPTTRPILFAPRSVNHMLPSSAWTMSCGCAAAVGSGNSWIDGAAWEVEHRASSAPQASTTRRLTA